MWEGLEVLLRILLDSLGYGVRRAHHRELDRRDPILQRPALAVVLYLSIFLAIGALAAWVYLQSGRG